MAEHSGICEHAWVSELMAKGRHLAAARAIDSAWGLEKD